MFNQINGYLDARIIHSFGRYITTMDKKMKYKKYKKTIQGGDIHRLLKIFDEKWLIIYVNKWHHLPYYNLIKNKEKVVIAPQNGPISSTRHHKRGIYSYNINYYVINKSSTVNQWNSSKKISSNNWIIISV